MQPMMSDHLVHTWPGVHMHAALIFDCTHNCHSVDLHGGENPSVEHVAMAFIVNVSIVSTLKDIGASLCFDLGLVHDSWIYMYN